MAQLLDPNEIMFTAFMPKLEYEFIMYIEGIPAFLVKAAKKPVINHEDIALDHINTKRHIHGKADWQPVQLTLYDAIVPSGAQAVMEWIRLGHESVTGRDGYPDFYKKDIVLNGLGPVGDKVEEWTGKGCYIQNADFGQYDWSNSAPVMINITVQADYWILQY